MSTRTSSAIAAALLLAACGRGEGSPSGARSEAAAGKGSPVVGCALAGRPFAYSCTLEHARVGGAPYLVIRHPDGAFRRFAVKDGSLAEADGSEQSRVSRKRDVLEIAVGSDRYRLTNKQLSDVP